ncbi:MAG: folate family ECF transporter S component [Clostridia bacterium]|nr:folate family ECF transporter S component [Clostridia bacterium]MBR6786867.1 folate family ECF transporter S component [Clostridia bacterium]
MDTLIRGALSFINDHSALVMILVLITLVLGLVSCFIVEKKRFTTKEISLLGMLIALNIIMAEVCKITILPRILELSLGFVPLALSGMLFGLVPTVTLAVVADIIGALLFNAGNFYFGYTLTAFMTGLFYGIFLHKKELPTLRIVICQLLVSLICYAFLNSLWALNWVTKTAAEEYIGIRLLAQLGTFPVYTLILLLMRRYRRTLEGVLKK